jgi:hypothetical protein
VRRGTRRSARAPTYDLTVTFEATVVRVLLASPGDTADERDLARTAIARWNSSNAMEQAVVLVPVGWESDSVPEWGDHPQSILNRQLVDSSDVLLGIFWTRLGTATPDSASGTVEEIQRFAKTGKPIMLYFCRKNADLTAIDTAQLDALREFEASCQAYGLYDTFGDAAEFESKLARGLTRTVTQRFAARTETASRLPVGRRLTAPPERKPEARLSAHLESHSRSSYRLVVANIGTVDVTGVNIEVPPEASSFTLHTDELPIDVLRPGERVALMALLHMGGGKSIFDVFLTGTTPDGDHLRFPSKISI